MFRASSTAMKMRVARERLAAIEAARLLQLEEEEMWPLRVKVRRMIKSSVFNAASIALIFAFSILLAFSRPLEPADSERNAAIAKAEKIFTVAFTLEVIAVWVAAGWLRFFKDSWNLLDLIVVIGGWMAFTPIESSGVNGLRTIRLVRPLRTLEKIEGIKRLVDCLVDSIRGLAQVATLILCFVLVFALFGLKLWKGDMRFQCVAAADVETEGPIGIGDCDLCQDATLTCVEGGNPNYGFSSFDNLGAGCLLVFQVVTLEGWTDIIDALDDVSPSGLVIPYFILVIGCGSFFIVNYMLAEICLVFTVKLQVNKQIEEFEKKEEERRKELQLGFIGMLKKQIVKQFEDAPILVLTVVEARNLRIMDSFTQSSDPYAVVKIEGQDMNETSVKRKSLTPRWDEAFEYRLNDAAGQVADIELFDSDFASSGLPRLSAPCTLFLSFLYACLGDARASMRACVLCVWLWRH